MAGIWSDERRQVLNGAYITFKSLSTAGGLSFGDVGVLAVAMPLSWGGPVSEVDIDSLSYGTSDAQIGLSLFDNDPKVINLLQALKNVNKVIIVRADEGGSKSTATLGSDAPLTAVARYSGTAGNNIAIAIRVEGTSRVVETYMSGRLKDTQVINTFDDLQDNEFVEFSGNGTPDATELTYLTGGTNGTVGTPDVFGLLGLYEYDVLYSTVTIPNIEELVRKERESGHLVQALVPYDESNPYDYEGIIQFAEQSFFDEKGVDITEGVRFYIAGVLAGASIDESATFHPIEFVKDVTPSNTVQELEQLKLNGVLFVRRRKNGDWVIEEDLNSLTTYTADRSSAYASNKVIRVLKVTHDWVIETFEGSYIGRGNTEVIRDVFKSEIANLMSQYETRGVIQNFDAKTDIVVRVGNDPSTLLVDLFIQPVGVLTKLYMNIIVSQNV